MSLLFLITKLASPITQSENQTPSNGQPCLTGSTASYFSAACSTTLPLAHSAPVTLAPSTAVRHSAHHLTPGPLHLLFAHALPPH